MQFLDGNNGWTPEFLEYLEKTAKPSVKLFCPPRGFGPIGFFERVLYPGLPAVLGDRPRYPNMKQ